MSKDLTKSKTVSLSIFISRILGLVREQIFSIFFGAGKFMDAYNVAFRIPNLLRDLFAEGAMSSAFVSRFSVIKKTVSEESAFELANKLICFLAIVVGSIVTLAIIFSDQLVSLYAHGLKPETAQMASNMVKIMFPFLWLVSIASVFTAMLNTFRRFGLPALAPALFNVGTIAGGGLIAYYFHKQDPNTAIYGMAIGTVIGGFLQWMLLLPQMGKIGFKFKASFLFAHPELKKILVMMIPAIIGQSAFQINLIITTSYASKIQEGSISWLSYAYRFMQFPIGIFAVAIAIVSLPNLAELIASKKTEEFRDSLSKSLQMGLFFALPASVGLYILSVPIIECIYGYGKFAESYDNIISTAGALKYYVLGLAAWSLVKIFVPAFYANNKTWVPMTASFLAIAINAYLCHYFVNSTHFDGRLHYGLAIATTAAAMVNALALFIVVQRHDWRLQFTPMLIYIMKLCLPTILLGGCAYYMNEFLRSQINPTSDYVLRALSLAGTIAVSVIVFIYICHKMKFEEISLIFGRFFKSKS